MRMKERRNREEEEESESGWAPHKNCERLSAAAIELFKPPFYVPGPAEKRGAGREKRGTAQARACKHAAHMVVGYYYYYTSTSGIQPNRGVGRKRKCLHLRRQKDGGLA